MDINTRVKSILECLNTGLYDKEKAIRLALLSAISGESIFLPGPPGTAKSMIARRIKAIFKSDNKESKPKYFEYLLNEFSTPDEIFGGTRKRQLYSQNSWLFTRCKYCFFG